jgi:chaperonin GroEL (HSP60 family)
MNFRSGRLEDMWSAGVVDSAMVGESVLVDSVSLAQMLLEVRACIVRREPRESDRDAKEISKSYRL